MLALCLLSTLLATSAATRVIFVDHDPMFGFPSPMFEDPYTHYARQQQQEAERARRFFQERAWNQQRQRAAAKWLLIEDYLQMLEEPQNAREFLEFVIYLQNNPEFTRQLFAEHPDFAKNFRAQPKDHHRRFYNRYPGAYQHFAADYDFGDEHQYAEPKKTYKDVAFPVNDSGSQAVSPDEAKALVKARIELFGGQQPKRLNYFSAVGVSENASSGEIKKAFVSLLRKIHPDKDGPNDNLIRTLNNVGEVLRSEKKLADYRRSLKSFVA